MFAKGPAMGEWAYEGLCRERDPDLFFEAPVEVARRVCKKCEVRTVCLAWELEQEPQDEGMWGGLTKRQRLVLLKKQRAA